VRDVREEARSEEEKHEDDDDEEDEEEDFDEEVVAGACEPRVPRPPKQITPEIVLTMLSDCHSLGIYAGMEGIAYNEEACNVARDIITTCGKDPNTVTYHEMEETRTRLECLRCSRAIQTEQRTKSARLVMKWSTAIVHELGEHYDELCPDSVPAWRKVDSSEDLKKVEKAEINIKQLKKYQNFVTCNHCSLSPEYNHARPQSYATPEEQLNHIARQHEISVDSATVSHHFSPELDAPIKLLYPPVRI